MKNALIPNFLEDSRQLIASKIVLLFSLSATGVFSVYNFIVGADKLFYIDATLFGIILFLTIFLIKKNIFLLAKIIISIMVVGLVFLIYHDDGTTNLYLWVFVMLFYLMFIFGHKKGFVYGTILFAIIFILMYRHIGVSITEEAYARFLFISVALVVIAYAYEHSINITLLSLENAQKDLERMVKIDSLTSLYNRRYFDEIFPKQIKITQRNNRLLVFAMVDIDSFKNYNDTYGHQAGDEVLKEVSMVFFNSFQRPDDYVFRLGGEEFGILFQADDKEESIKKLEAIISNIENLKIAHCENSASTYVTISMGINIVKPTDKHDCDDIYKLADDALYGAKQKGKNRVEVL